MKRRGARAGLPLAASVGLLWSAAAPAFEKPAPLGLELGAATCEKALHDAHAAASDLAEVGVNNIAGGRQLEGSGHGLGIEGLTHVRIACDGGDHVVGVSFTYRKEAANFRRLYEALAKRYEIAKKVDPDEGDHYVRFMSPAASVELLAPYKGNEMFMEYATPELQRATAEAAKAAKR